MIKQRIDVLPIANPAGYGLKSKTKKWFAYYYKTEATAFKVAQNIESRWTSNDDEVNFSSSYPVRYVDR